MYVWLTWHILKHPTIALMLFKTRKKLRKFNVGKGLWTHIKSQIRKGKTNNPHIQAHWYGIFSSSAVRQKPNQLSLKSVSFNIQSQILKLKNLKS